MGTPEFAVPSLRRLREDGHLICGVFTQPDKPKNRGMKLQVSPVKEYALTYDLPIFQPVSWKDGSAVDMARSCDPELIVVVAYGKILPKALLDLPRKGCINVHASLLPRYRGAAPINWVILNGEEETGVTIMELTEELDAGDMLSAERTKIGPEETSEELYHRLKDLGAGLLSGTVRQIADGTAVRTPQNHADATYAPMLSRDMSAMDWRRSACQLHRQVRGLLPWPAAATVLSGSTVKVLASRVSGTKSDASPGTVVSMGNAGLEISCGDGNTLLITELQAQGGRRMKAADYLRGHPISKGTILS
jgi:methionyl-tRNA formyltransferase